jgi:hypothetical protein
VFLAAATPAAMEVMVVMVFVEVDFCPRAAGTELLAMT